MGERNRKSSKIHSPSNKRRSFETRSNVYIRRACHMTAAENEAFHKQHRDTSTSPEPQQGKEAQPTKRTTYYLIQILLRHGAARGRRRRTGRRCWNWRCSRHGLLGRHGHSTSGAHASTSGHRAWGPAWRRHGAERRRVKMRMGISCLACGR